MFGFKIKDIITVFALLVTVESAIGQGAVNLKDAFPVDWIPHIQAWSNLLALIGGAIITTLSRMAGDDVPPSTLTKALIIPFLALFLLHPSPANSADVPSPVKTSVVSALFNGYTGSGLYFGFYSEGGGGSINGSVPGVGSTSLTTTSAGVGALGGYAWSNASGNVFYAVEAQFGWQNFNGNQSGLALTGPVSFTQRAMIGTPLSTVWSVLPSFNNLPTTPPLPTLPTGVTASNAHPYIFAGISEDAIGTTYGLGENKVWRVAPVVGFGSLWQLSNATAVDTYIKFKLPEKGTCVGIAQLACASLGNQVIVGAAVKW